MQTETANALNISNEKELTSLNPQLYNSILLSVIIVILMVVFLKIAVG